jgi:hypothetical protein
LNILLSFLQDKNEIPYNIPSYRFWTYYIKNGIEEAGMSWCEVPGVDWAEGLTYSKNLLDLKMWQDQVWTKTLEFVKSGHLKIDIFLSYLYPQQIEINAIKEIRKTGIPCVNFYCDNIRHFTNVPNEFKCFDMLWIPEYEAIQMYHREQVKTINLPMPMWVKPNYREQFKPLESPVIGFIGSNSRKRLVK